MPYDQDHSISRGCPRRTNSMVARNDAYFYFPFAFLESNDQ